MSELFDIPESKSPRLLWLEEQKLLTHYFKGEETPWICIQPLERDKGKEMWECMADHARLYEEANLIGYGQTEDEAIRDWAANTETKLWNEISYALPQKS